MRVEGNREFLSRDPQLILSPPQNTRCPWVCCSAAGTLLLSGTLHLLDLFACFVCFIKGLTNIVTFTVSLLGTETCDL